MGYNSDTYGCMILGKFLSLAKHAFLNLYGTENTDCIVL